MTQVLVALLGGAVSALAFPRFGPGLLIVPGVTLFMWALRRARGRGHGAVIGLVFGLVFFTGLMWWSIELGLIALLPLVIVLSLFPAALGWGVGGHAGSPPLVWFGYAVGGWALMELVRYHFPFSGLEWGGAGYALSAFDPVRAAASLIGTSGWTVLVVALAAALVLALEGERSTLVMGALAAPFVMVLIGMILTAITSLPDSDPIEVAIVQGSTPCPYEKCPPDERLRTYQQHLELTEEIEPGSADLVVWAEGSSGSFNADPVQNPEVGAAIGEEAARIGAWIIVGTDRPISEENWVNANVVFSPDGEIVGEYRKQQGVPFGEYIPFRPLFDWIPDLEQVPRDMVPGNEPVVFDTGFATLGSVISFEGSFARYSLQHVRAGADLIVIATNEGSYGTTPASDQLIAMTRMRAAELGVPVAHAAVTGKSVVIDQSGDFASSFSGLGTQEIIEGVVYRGSRTFYSYAGDWMLYVSVALGLLVAWRRRRLLVSR